MTFSSRKKLPLEVLSAADIPTNLGKLIYMYGAGGAGKTEMCGSLYDYPDTADTLFLQNDLRGLNTLRVSRANQLKWARCDTYEAFDSWIESNKEHPEHQHIVVDHFTKTIYTTFEHIIGHPQPWDWREYAAPTSKVKGYIEALDTMAAAHNMLIVLILHDVWAESDEDGTKGTRYEFNLTGGVAKAILPTADMVLHLKDLQDSRGTRRLTLRGANTLAKKRIARGSVEDTLPSQITFPSYPTFVPILETLWGQQPFDTAKYGGKGRAIDERDPNQGNVVTVIQ